MHTSKYAINADLNMQKYVENMQQYKGSKMQEYVEISKYEICIICE